MDRVALEELFDRALLEQETADTATSLVALHAHPVEETFAIAARWLRSEQFAHRRLALRVLKELGHDRKPFAERSLDLLLPLFDQVQSPAERRELVSAIGWQNRPRALPTLLGLVDDDDLLVRYLVAQHLPGCSLTPDGADPRGIAALLQLTTDPDGDIRFYATAAFECDYPALDSEAIRAALEARTHDLDETVRRSAIAALKQRSP